MILKFSFLLISHDQREYCMPYRGSAKHRKTRMRDKLLMGEGGRCIMYVQFYIVLTVCLGHVRLNLQYK